ncbi:hypothetical protein Tco_0547880 [Tanacetum coccineum]
MTHSNPRRNMTPQAVLMRSGIKVVNTAKQRMRIMLSRGIDLILLKLQHVGSGCQRKEMHRLRGGKSIAKIKDNDERQRISIAEGLIQELLQKIFIEVNHKFRRGLLGIKLSELSTAKSKVSTAHKLQLPVLTNSALVKNRSRIGINNSSMVHHQSYQALDDHQPSQTPFPIMDSGLVVLLFLPSDDPITSLNKAMDLISTTFTS